ncbi:MAG: D-alanine--D-alanine ligase [Desulfobacterales bacterium]|nr:D-alanine--D-alanine ligase [Desulfobacterales bacterium]
MASKQWRNKRIGVLMGGISREREVSLKTGSAMLKALQEGGYQARGIEVSADIVQRLQQAQIDVAVIALHGRWGEDGTVQGLLELLRIPYTGSGVLASALAMNKIKAKEIFLYHGLPTPEFITPEEDDPEEPPFPPPWVVKPASEGSTIGIDIVMEREGLQEAVRRARGYDHEVLVERFIKGKELTVAILKKKPLPIVEIVPLGGFYDYQAKYTPGQTAYICPAQISDRQQEEIGKLGLKAYQVLGCSGCARVDLLLSEQGEAFITEVNTLPGMTETSLVPKAAAQVGISFLKLVEIIVEEACLKIEEGAG